MAKAAQSTCGSPQHELHRRLFLQGTLAAGTASMLSFSGLFNVAAIAEEAKRQEKHCILLWLCGAPSQFETWDPKPGRPSSGPFGTIASALPGVHFSELMPRCARIADQLAVIRSMKTSQTEHFQAIDLLNRGDEPRPPFIRPALGSILGQQLAQLDNPIPSFILLDPCPEGNEYKRFKAGNWAGWLGAEYGPVRLGGEYRVDNLELPPEFSDAEHADREALRAFFSRKFENDRRSEAAGSYNAAFQRVKGLMSCAPLFDMERLPAAEKEKYGPGTFGLHVLLARHLVENGAPFVMISNGMPWDCHVYNHEMHQMLVPELDHVLAQLIGDLRERGLLEKTLVIAMGEFGRTPWINEARGRDHYPNAWSLAMAGCGIREGVVFGETDRDGIDVARDPVDQRRLFATIFKTLGIDPHVRYDLPGLPEFHRVEQSAEPIHELLST
jgi:hypothetical protein